ncbi:hypothetical protein LTS12_024361 [Elasticomyces elasticus]|nr:hypothetical protein LTS12_024361 [Elasticomyces elasticus]
MAGYLQLAYLGMLLLSSLGEVLATQLVRSVQGTAVHYGTVRPLTGNRYWSKAVIRSALSIDEKLSLAALPWMDLGMFPNQQVWHNLCNVLSLPRTELDLLKADAIVNKLCPSKNATDAELNIPRRLADEIIEARKAGGSAKALKA